MSHEEEKVAELLMVLERLRRQGKMPYKKESTNEK